MSTQIQRRRGTTAEHSTFTGVEGELTIDTTKDTAVVHDGTTVGGHPLQKQYPALGSASTPTYTFTGDTNTGIYSPGADQLAISTNSVGRVFVDAGGNVVVGTSLNGLNGLSVQLGSTSGLRYAGVVGPAYLTNFDATYLAYYGSTASGSLAGLSAAGLGALAFQNTSAGLIYTNGGTPLVFATASQERLRITSSGLVGVGTSAPSASLHVSTSSGNEVGLLLANTAATSRMQFASSGGGGDVYIGSKSSGFVIQTSGSSFSDKFFIDSSGRVGIGTSSPEVRLDVTGSTGITAIKFTDNTNATGRLGTPSAGLVAFGGAVGHAIAFGGWETNASFSAERMRIDSSGRVGIGSTLAGNANNRLLVRSDSASAITNALLLNNGTLDNNAGQGVRINLSGVSEANSHLRYAYIEAANQTSGNDHYLAFGTNPVGATPQERARIDSSGRLLVGTSSASGGSKTEINSGTDTSAIRITDANYDGSGSTFLYPVAAYYARTQGVVRSANPLAAGGATAAIVFTDEPGNATFVENLRSSSIRFYTGANSVPGFANVTPTERMRIRSDGASLYHSSASNGIVLGITGSSGTSNRLFSGGHSASSIGVYTETFLVWSNGNVQNTNGSYTTISDAKLKENIVDAGSQWDDLKAIQIRNWNFKAETGHETHRQIGPIAQELEAVCPGLVFETPDRDADGNETGEVTKGVNQSVLYMKAVKALQEAMERIEQLEQRLTDAGIA